MYVLHSIFNYSRLGDVTLLRDRRRFVVKQGSKYLFHVKFLPIIKIVKRFGRGWGEGVEVSK